MRWQRPARRTLLCILLCGMAILAPVQTANGASSRAATGATSTVQAGGMEMSLSIPPGPYFLGELLRTTVSLANISGKPIAYTGEPWDTPCFSTLGRRTLTRMEPTPYPDVNAALHDLLASTQAILGERFHGMYLSGSLALGDFNARRSDIDYVVVTDADLTADLFSALQVMHARFNTSDSPWATEVEAIYMPLQALRHHDPPQARHPHIQRGADQVLEMDDLGGGWVIHAAILREHGVAVSGPPIRPLIDPIEPDALRRAVLALMEEWWEPMRYNPASLQRRGYQAYTVLTMCRILYTMEFGAVVSKPRAAHWAQQRLAGRWDGLIERALVWRKDLQEPIGEDVRETLDLVHHTLERCRAWVRLP